MGRMYDDRITLNPDSSCSRIAKRCLTPPDNGYAAVSVHVFRIRKTTWNTYSRLRSSRCRRFHCPAIAYHAKPRFRSGSSPQEYSLRIGNVVCTIDLFRKEKKTRELFPTTPGTNSEWIAVCFDCLYYRFPERTTFHNHLYNILGLFRILWCAIQRTSQITRTRRDD